MNIEDALFWLLVTVVLHLVISVIHYLRVEHALDDIRKKQLNERPTARRAQLQ